MGFPFWGDATGVRMNAFNSVPGNALDRASSNISNPAKGMYIMNGKKYIRK